MPRQARERVIVGDLNGVALDDDVQSCVPLVAAGRQDHVRVDPQVDGLLLGEAGAEVDGPSSHTATSGFVIFRLSYFVGTLLLMFLTCL